MKEFKRLLLSSLLGLLCVLVPFTTIQIEDVSAVGSDSMRVMQELRDSGLSVVQLMHRPTWKQERVERALVSGVFVCVYL